MEPAFIAVTGSNVDEISQRLNAEGGHLLGCHTYWGHRLFSISMYIRPILIFNGKWSLCARHWDYEPGKPLDRDYAFGKVSDAFHSRFLVGSYKIRISATCMVACGFNPERPLQLYVPRASGLLDTFEYIFRNPVVPLVPPLEEPEIEALLAHIKHDLETGNVVAETLATTGRCDVGNMLATA